MQMICAWQELLSVLPPWMRAGTDKLGQKNLQELRMRINAPPELVCTYGIRELEGTVHKEDLDYCINAASRYSPWNAATAAKGYITAPGGHRIGLCGECVIQDGRCTGIRDLSSLCLRVARDFPGISADIKDLFGSVLILGAPGWGKTTLLRDLCRRRAQTDPVCVLDERGEVFPSGLPRGKRMDILTGCSKPAGVEMLLRTMSPSWIAMDEITAEADCEAILQASNCGVGLIATAHAANLQDYFSRIAYRKLARKGIFQLVIVLRRDKSFSVERMDV